ncbi:hypothetical protein AXK57_00065 [Tsukamurella pulmonis]|nr:hypothetical protein AXK57_00065 [Tsukamurella pulmonis]
MMLPRSHGSSCRIVRCAFSNPAKYERTVVTLMSNSSASCPAEMPSRTARAMSRRTPGLEMA